MWRNGRRNGLKIRGSFDLESSTLSTGTIWKKIMKWTDIEEIARSLEEEYPTIDNRSILFVKLRQLVIQLKGFNDNKDNCSERILEAIQAAWIQEREE